MGGGKRAHGFEGLCVGGSLSEANETTFMLLGTCDKGKVLKETVRLQFCKLVDELVSNPRQLFNFVRVSHEKKVSMLGRYGITDVSCSGPFEKVDAKKFKPEGCHIQLWLVLLEQAFPQLVGYSLELLHTLFAQPEDGEETAKLKVLCDENQ